MAPKGWKYGFTQDRSSIHCLVKYSYDITRLLMLNVAGSLVVGTLGPNDVNKILTGPSNDEITVEMINDEQVH